MYWNRDMGYIDMGFGLWEEGRWRGMGGIERGLGEGWGMESMGICEAHYTLCT